MRTKLDTQENQQRSTKNLVNHRKLALIQNCILTCFFCLETQGPSQIAHVYFFWTEHMFKASKLHFNICFFLLLRNSGPQSNRTCVKLFGRNTCSKPQVHDTHFLVPSNVRFRIFRSSFSKLPNSLDVLPLSVAKDSSQNVISTNASL